MGSTPVAAEDIAGIVAKLEKELHVAKKHLLAHPQCKTYEWFKDVDGLTGFLIEIYKERRRLNFTVAAGYKGDIAGDEKLNSLDVNVGVSKGTFRRAFSLGVGTNLQFKNSGLLEDVTKLKLGYDHYYNRFFKTFGFVDRFSDSYLSLSHRYEVGGGVKFEWDLFGLSSIARKKWAKFLGHKKKLQDLIQCYERSKDSKKCDKHSCVKKCKTTLKSYFGCNIDRKAVIALLKALVDEEQEDCNCKSGKVGNDVTRETIRAFLKQHKILTLGFAVIALSEMEKAEITTSVIETVTDEEGEATETVVEDSVKFPLDATQRYRLVLQPSIVVRPIDSIILKGIYSHKLPLGIPRKVDGKVDYRSHLLVRAEYVMWKTVTWAKSVSVVFEYQRDFDHVPPAIPGDDVTKYQDDYKEANKSVGTISLGKTEAEKSHERFQWKLEIKF